MDSKIIVFVLILLSILGLLYFINYVYYYYINKYFIKDNHIIYDFYLNNIQVVSKNNYYMNYGLWDSHNNTLIKANMKLANFIFDKAMFNMEDKINVQLLDVGCGYGEQDILWSKKLNKTCKITAIDISEKQIDIASKKALDQNIKKQNLTFKVCDALDITKQFESKTFSIVLSLESAFHYSNRPLFFKNVSTILKNNGKFVICDIVLNKTYINPFRPLFLKLFKDFFNVPNNNLINAEQWSNDLTNSGFEIVEYIDITQNTFVPYYKHFFENYIKNINLPSFIADMLIYIFNYAQPFNYVVAVCKK